MQKSLVFFIIIVMKGSFVKILISSRYPILNEGIKTILQREKIFYILGTIDNSPDTVIFTKKYHPEIIIINPFYNDEDPVKFIENLLEIKPAPSIILLTDQTPEEQLIKFIEIGIQSIVTYEVAPERLINIVKMVYNGETLINEILATKLLKKMISKEKSALGNLSEREKEIISLVAQGMSNKEIGEKLFISERTVKNHLSSIYKKINVKDRTQAAIMIIKEGLI